MPLRTWNGKGRHSRQTVNVTSTNGGIVTRVGACRVPACGAQFPPGPPKGAPRVIIGGYNPRSNILKMLNADDRFTVASLNSLRDAVRQGRRLVVWVGAGASRWADLPSWHDLAKQMRKIFARNIPDFPNDLAESRIASKAYPELFQLCKDIDIKLFNSTLLRQISAPAINPIYL